MRRRDFLSGLGFASLAGTLSFYGVKNFTETKLGSTSPFNWSGEELIASGFLVENFHLNGSKFSPAIMITDLEGKILFEHDLIFFPHAIFQHPLHPGMLLMTNKSGASAAMIDMDQERKPKYFQPSAKSVFYGHSAFLPDGKSFVSTEKLTDSRGKLVIRDTRTLNVIQEYIVPGYGPHDCHLMKDGKTLAVGIDGIQGEEKNLKKNGHSGIYFLDLNNGKILGYSPLEDDELSMGHFVITSDNDIVSGLVLHNGENSSGCAAVGKMGSALKTLNGVKKVEKRLRSSLSIALDESRTRALITFPHCNLMIVWDYKAQICQGSVEVPCPTGISVSLDGSFYTLTDLMGFIYTIDPLTLQVVNTFSPIKSGNRTAHHSFINKIRI